MNTVWPVTALYAGPLALGACYSVVRLSQKHGRHDGQHQEHLAGEKPFWLPKTSPVFWFMMQIAMLAGFLASYPVNGWLIRRGIKGKM